MGPRPAPWRHAWRNRDAGIRRRCSIRDREEHCDGNPRRPHHPTPREHGRGQQGRQVRQCGAQGHGARGILRAHWRHLQEPGEVLQLCHGCCGVCRRGHGQADREGHGQAGGEGVWKQGRRGRELARQPGGRPDPCGSAEERDGYGRASRGPWVWRGFGTGCGGLGEDIPAVGYGQDLQAGIGGAVRRDFQRTARVLR